MANILVARLARGLYERSEISDWLVESFLQKRPQDQLSTISLDYFPTTTARHKAVVEARRRSVDLLCMIDHDMVPVPGSGYLNRAAEFLATRPCAMVGYPYRSGWPEWATNVWRETAGGNRVRVSNEESAGLTATERVGQMGLGLVIVGMACFDMLQLPYFDYQYGQDFSELTASEDIYFTRNLTLAGGEVYCDWSRWVGHAKVDVVGRPE